MPNDKVERSLTDWNIRRLENFAVSNGDTGETSPYSSKDFRSSVDHKSNNGLEPSWPKASA